MLPDTGVTRPFQAQPGHIAPRHVIIGADHILYDDAAIPPPDASFFDPLHWQGTGAVTGLAEGRGAACIFAWRDADYVLRHYRRGGWVARLSDDRYCWTGLQRTRAWREWHLLAAMHAEGLPVPRPVAARVRPGGLTYQADLVTRCLPGVQPLADLLMREALPEAGWRRIGGVICRLHAAGVYHADLNARNILLDGHGQVFVIDFDKAERRGSPDRWRHSNLARLRRSLAKFHAAGAPFHFEAPDWEMLLAGYQDASR